jgi:hypothetical protein
VDNLVLEPVVETILLVAETNLVAEAPVDQMAVYWDGQTVEALVMLLAVLLAVLLALLFVK